MMKNKQTIINKWDIVLVKWNDAGGAAMWHDASDYKTQPYNINTVGQFIGVNDEHFIVSQNHDVANNNIGHVMHIPPQMITHIEVLRRAKTTH